MDQNFQTSFIPKKPIIKERTTYVEPVGILLVASLIILFTVLISTAGFYFYKISLLKNIADKKETLISSKNRLELSKIAEMQILDKRLNASSEILSKHVTVAPIFNELEKITMKTVRYTRFSYSFSGEKNVAVDIKMAGIATSYGSVALQSDLFGSNKNLIEPIFSNLTLDSKGNVMFDLQFSVDTSFINYKQSLLIQS